MRSRVATLALVLAFPALAASAQAKLSVQKLAEGIWAAQPDKGANVGWFLYGDGVVAVDSGGDAATAKEILRQIALLVTIQLKKRDSLLLPLHARICKRLNIIGSSHISRLQTLGSSQSLGSRGALVRERAIMHAVIQPIN